MRAWLLTSVAALALAATGAHARPQEQQCGNATGAVRCATEPQPADWERFRLPSIEMHRDAGDQMRRAFYVDDYGRDVVAISFVRARGRDPMVFVHTPPRDSAPREPLSAVVPKDVWDDVIQYSALFDRDLVPLPPRPDGEITVCLHSWGYSVEASDPPAGANRGPSPVRRKIAVACDGDPAAAFAQVLERLTLRLLAPCVTLDREQYRTPASVLAACSTLRGDRLAAAVAMNQAVALTRAVPWRDPSEMTGTVERLFGFDAVVDWNGERQTREQAVRFWLERVSSSNGLSLSIDSAEGLSAGSALVFASLRRDVTTPDAKAVEETARVEMAWEIEGARFRLQRMTVGPFIRSGSQV